MPGGDRTGPMGAGAMTGRAAGFCAGYAAAGWVNTVGGRGRGFWGRGCGRGRGRGYGLGIGRFGQGPATPTREHELEMLRQQATEIQRRIDELSADAK
jgi:hypothetical protein